MATPDSVEIEKDLKLDASKESTTADIISATEVPSPNDAIDGITNLEESHLTGSTSTATAPATLDDSGKPGCASLVELDVEGKELSRLVLTLRRSW